MQVTCFGSYEYGYTFKITLAYMTQTGHQTDNSLRELFFSAKVPIFKLIFILTLLYSSYEFALS